MKRSTVILLFIILLLPFSASAWDLKDPAKFIGGAVSAYALHEAGHYLAAEITDTDLDTRWFDSDQIVSLYMAPETNKDGLRIVTAGLIAQAVCSEVILDMGADKSSPFVQGMMFWNVLNPLQYAADYWWTHRTNKLFSNGFQGDISGVEYYTDKKTADAFAGTMVLLALWHGYRWYSDASIQFTFEPLPIKKGIGLQLVYKF